MAGLWFKNVYRILETLENSFFSLFRNQFPPSGLAVAGIDAGYSNRTSSITSSSVENIFGSGFLWAVPVCRRSVERRLKRKFGDPNYVYKLILPKKNLLVCNTCGHHYEATFLCPHCYAKVREETEDMQTAIQEELKLSPVENEVVVIYEGEKEEKPTEFWQGKRVVEMKKQRPPWFSKNLMEKSTVQPSSSVDVKPTELA